jgi:hypothetical protein
MLDPPLNKKPFKSRKEQLQAFRYNLNRFDKDFLPDQRESLENEAASLEMTINAEVERDKYKSQNGIDIFTKGK